MRHELDLRGMSKDATSQGPGSADDTSTFVTATVYDWDSTHAQVQVGINGGVVWLPAMAGRYALNSLARVQMDNYKHRPALVLGPVFPQDSVVVMPVTATGSGTITTQPYGIAYTIPSSGTYTVGQSAWCITNDWGEPVYALAPNSTSSLAGTAPSAPPVVTTKKVTATISPQYSGTYKVSSSRWDSWNPDRYGGRSDIYQGDHAGSGTLRGFAGYGNQIVNLHAISIESITFRARKNDTNGLSARLGVQGSPSGSKPGGSPSFSGDKANSDVVIDPGKWGTVTFTSDMREDFRTGSHKGLVAVGSTYGGFGGTGTPGSFVLTVKYTKKV